MTTNQTIDGVPVFYAIDPLDAYPEPVGTDDKIERSNGALWVHLNGKRSKLIGLQSLDFLISQLVQIKGEIFGTKPAAQTQVKPVAWQYRVSAGPQTGWSLWHDGKGEEFKQSYQVETRPLYAEQPAPVAVVIPVRSPKDYAIEHAEYMAKSADDVMAKFQAYGLAIFAVDEGGDDGEGELLENIDSARGDLQESLVELRSMVYEFRKRAAESR